MTKILNILVLIVSVWIRTGSAVVLDCINIYYGHEQKVDASLVFRQTIASPNYPSPFSNYRTWCVWILAAPDPGFVVKVVFSDLHLEDDQSTNRYDRCAHVGRLMFTNGTDRNGATIGTYCGSVAPEVFYSTGQFLRVEFAADQNINAYRGFNFSFMAVKKEEASAICRGPWIYPRDPSSVRGSSGTFFTPDYPIPYRHQEDCRWRITVPAFKRVKLTFEAFELSKTHIDCPRGSDSNDHVEVRDGSSVDNYEIASFCEYNTADLPPPVYSTSRVLLVIFRSFGPDTRKDWKGFKARFEAVDQLADINSTEVCFPGNMNNENLRLTGERGTLKTPLDRYPPNMNCTWTITVPEGNIVELTFVGSLYLSGPGDYIVVFDGLHRSGKILKDEPDGYFSGNILRSSGRYMTVIFRSDSDDYHRYPGFKATFKAVRNDSWKGIELGVGLSVGILVLIVFSVVCIAKCGKCRKCRTSSNTETANDRMPMTTSAGTTLLPATQLTDRPNPTAPTPTVAYVPVPTTPPPPYPGEEVPQYPPPGKSYPWFQNT